MGLGKRPWALPGARPPARRPLGEPRVWFTQAPWPRLPAFPLSQVAAPPPLGEVLDARGPGAAGDRQRSAHLVHLLLVGALPPQPLLVHATVQVVLARLGQELADPREDLYGI